jgi:hypothetical protein
VFPDWEVTIMNDEDYSLRNMMENWSNEMNTLISNRMSNRAHPMAYKADAHVTHYAKNGPVIREYSFQGLWPKVVDTMQLDWASVNQIQEFNVVFAYDLWVPAGQTRYSPTLNPA